MVMKLATDNDLESRTFLSGGVMIYCEEDKQFIFAKKQTTDKVREKIAYLQKMGKLTTFYPMEVHIAILRKNLTIENIGKYYKEDIMRLNTNSKDFIAKYLHDPINIRHTKTKGRMDAKDVLVSTYITYVGTKNNTSLFNL